jgi:hypothetical protein
VTNSSASQIGGLRAFSGVQTAVPRALAAGAAGVAARVRGSADNYNLSALFRLGLIGQIFDAKPIKFGVPQMGFG